MQSPLSLHPPDNSNGRCSLSVLSSTTLILHNTTDNMEQILTPIKKDMRMDLAFLLNDNSAHSCIQV